MYVVCLLFYAIGDGCLFLYFFIGQDWPIDYLWFYVSERDDYYFLLFNSFSISSILGMVPSI